MPEYIQYIVITIVIAVLAIIVFRNNRKNGDDSNCSSGCCNCQLGDKCNSRKKDS